MIVSCPSCKTRYHWRAEAGGRAVCDRCEAEVPLVASRPEFVVRARTEAVALRASAWGAAVATAPLPRAAEPAPVSAAQPMRVAKGPAPAPPVPFEAEPLSLAPAAADLDWSSVGERGRADRAAAPARSSRHAGARPPSRLRRTAQLAVVVIFTGAGVAAGHYAMMRGVIGPLRVHPNVDPLDPLLVGGLVGMLIAWPLIRWMAPRR